MTIKTPDPEPLRRYRQHHLEPAWTAAEEAVTSLEGRSDRDARRKKASDDELAAKYRMEDK